MPARVIEKLSAADRIAGAVVGSFIGDALGLGVHWYYDLDELHADHGNFVTDYTTPRPGRYHEAQQAGDLSQSGYMLQITVESILRVKGYCEEEFCRTFDQELFAKMDGTSVSGPGGYTCEATKHVYRARVLHREPWGPRTSGSADSTEAIERAVALAVLYAKDPATLARQVANNASLTQHDVLVVSHAVAFAAVLSQLVEGHPLDGDISDRLMVLHHEGRLPYHGPIQAAGDGERPRALAGTLPSPEPLFTPATSAALATDAAVTIDPPYRVASVYGMSCAAYKVLPSAYYLGARYAQDFESAVLHAINGGGHTTARGLLTGALVGAQVGLQGIPERLVKGLRSHELLVGLAEQLAALATLAEAEETNTA